MTAQTTGQTETDDSKRERAMPFYCPQCRAQYTASLREAEITRLCLFCGASFSRQDAILREQQRQRDAARQNGARDADDAQRYAVYLAACVALRSLQRAALIVFATTEHAEQVVGGLRRALLDEREWAMQYAREHDILRQSEML